MVDDLGAITWRCKGRGLRPHIEGTNTRADGWACGAHARREGAKARRNLLLISLAFTAGKSGGERWCRRWESNPHGE